MRRGAYTSRATQAERAPTIGKRASSRTTSTKCTIAATVQKPSHRRTRVFYHRACAAPRRMRTCSRQYAEWFSFSAKKRDPDRLEALLVGDHPKNGRGALRSDDAIFSMACRLYLPSG